MLLLFVINLYLPGCFLSAMFKTRKFKSLHTIFLFFLRLSCYNKLCAIRIARKLLKLNRFHVTIRGKFTENDSKNISCNIQSIQLY